LHLATGFFPMPKSFLLRHKYAASVLVPAAVVATYGFRKFQALAADPVGEKDCGPVPAESGSQLSRRN
jgi:hypothetical protein